ncbi:MAG: adenylyltransferase/cytidyltransferase family protein [Bacilli bacterium]|nr:adenylyltransferase/cytidyltransferase family protein [Bacilli bacterium]
MYKYKIGMYGGKFMPLHKGHNYCIETAAKECEKLYVIMFYGGKEEETILKINKEKDLTVKSRKDRVIRVCKKYKNVVPNFIDISKLRLVDGSEDWDAETPLVREIIGDNLNAVYSSETSYDNYFKRAYPEAVHRIVDSKRINYPISGTKIRKIKNREERKLWTI